MVNRSASKGSPATPKESGSKDEKKSGATTTSGKKMKQTRLPFASKNGDGDGIRKRKLSSPELPNDRTVKIVRREGDPEVAVVILDDDVEVEEKEIEEQAQPVAVEEEDADMVEIIPSEDSNSVALPSADISLIEDEDEIIEEAEDDKEDPANESVNLNNSSSEDDKGGQEAALANMLEPPANPTGKPLTPRQLEKFLEKKARHEERLRQKIEREKKLEDERKQREDRERQKKREREEREEAKRKEREDKEAARLREKEEKETAKQREKEERERKRQLELEQKNEEKKRREEQKEEERRKKEDEKRAKELEDEQKRKRASQAFTKFFKVGPKAEDENNCGGAQPQTGTGSTDDVVVVVNPYFMPFAVKGDMKLAPTVRRLLDKDARGALERVLKETSGSVAVQELYLKSLRTKSHVPLRGTKTWNSADSSDDDSEDELMIVDDELAHKVEKIGKSKQRYRAKCLMFKENRRPAYFGTWQKKSKLVGPRTPFAKDEKFFDYEVESDDEWEEEEPGESLHGSEDEKESEDDYEVDNEFFVPHGHLSDEELQNEDNEMDDNSPEAQKVKLKLLQDEFNDEMKKKTEKIKPRLIGCIWVNESGGRPENCPEVFWDLLQFRAVLSAGPIVLQAPPCQEAAEQGDGEADAEDNDGEKTNRRKGQSLAEEEIRDLIRLVHGNLNSNKFMVKEFQMYREKKAEANGTGSAAGVESTARVVTNMSILRKIKEIAKWENACWVVQKEFLEHYEMADQPLVNKWEYALTPKRTHDTMKAEKKQAQATGQQQQAATQVVEPAAPKTPVRPAVEKDSPPSAKQEKTNRNSITQFTKVLTTEEKQKQFQSISIAPSPKQNQSAILSTANENKAPSLMAAAAAAVTPKAATISKCTESVEVSPAAVTKATSNHHPPPAKKRVPLLMSVPRGQAISEQSKSLLIKNFLTKQPVTDLKKPVADASGSGAGQGVIKEPAIVETIVLD